MSFQWESKLPSGNEKGKMRKKKAKALQNFFKVYVQCTSRHSQTSEESSMFLNNAPLKDI